MPLDVQIPLLYVSPRRISMSADSIIGSQCWTAVRGHETRYIGRGKTREVATRRCNNSTTSEGSWLCATKAIGTPRRKYRTTGKIERAPGSIQHCSGRYVRVRCRVKGRAGEVHHVVVRIQSK